MANEENSVKNDDINFMQEDSILFPDDNSEPQSPEPDEVMEEYAAEEAEEASGNRKWLYLLGVIVTWIAIFVLIFAIHRNRNDGEQKNGQDAEVAAMVAD